MAILKTYSPKEVVISWNGVNINSGIAPDTFITVSRDEDAFNKVVGADGTVARTRNSNRSGTIEISLMQNSDVNKALMAQALLDEAEGGEIISTLSIADPSDPTGVFLTTALDCWIKKIPDMEYSGDYGTRTWAFDCADLSISQAVNDL